MPPRPFRSASGLLAVAALAGQALAPVSTALAESTHAAASPGVEVKVGKAGAFSRLEIHGARPRLSMDGSVVVARFAGAAPDIARLHVAPPPFLKSAEKRTTAAGTELRFTPADGDEARFGYADGAAWINVSPPPPKPAEAPAAPPPRPNPVPASGAVRMGSELRGSTLLLRFPWRAPLGAAVFRRGEAVWIVFDAAARLDLSAAPRGLRQARGFQPVSGPGFTALRVLAPADVRVGADGDAAAWTVSFGPDAPAPAGVDIRRDAAGPSGLEARMAGSTGVVWLTDPAVGDKLAVVTALAPAKGLAAGRSFVEAAFLPTAAGLAVRPIADDLAVQADGDLVHVGRPRGLALSPEIAAPVLAAAAEGSDDLPAPAALPALIDPAWARTGEGGFLARYDRLLDGAARETQAGPGAGVRARLGLARFLVGSDLAFEAIGVLNTLLKASPALGDDAEFRGLRGAARAMVGRWKDAEADFSTPATAEDPASALWRGYAAAQQGDAAGARGQFARGRPALAQFPARWRARLARADAETAVAVGDLGAAKGALALATGPLDPDETDGLRLAQARLVEASGQAAPALALYEAVARSPYGAVAAPAELAALRLRLAKGAIPVPEALAALDSLRFRWRGDATEMETIRELGRMDIAQGRYREALEALRSAGGRLPDLPASIALHTDLADAFKALFLEGRADGMEPIQALALFYDFKELTPVGADGDLMVRRLVKRLADVDLLDQAADLLRYQVDNRLNGAAKAQVATDLAAIELMAGKPDGAINAIEGSRSTLLPMALNIQRRLLEARALVMLGRYDHALELVGTETSPDALEVKALAAWKGRDWPAAGRWMEARLGERWKSPAPLDPADTALLIRTGAAYTLAGDDQALARVRGRYAKLAVDGPQREALGVALAGLGGSGGGTEPATAGGAFGRAVGDADVLAGWVRRMKTRLGEVGGGAPAPVRTASAAAPGPRGA